MYWEVHHILEVHGNKKVCSGNKGFHPLEKFYHLHKERPAISSRTKVKQEVDLCVRKKCFRDDGGLGQRNNQGVVLGT
jgi:hypothetical protein